MKRIFRRKSTQSQAWLQTHLSDHLLRDIGQERPRHRKAEGLSHWDLYQVR